MNDGRYDTCLDSNHCGNFRGVVDRYNIKGDTACSCIGFSRMEGSLDKVNATTDRREGTLDS